MTGGLPPVLSDQRRATITAHLVAHSGELTTHVVEAIQSRHSWFTRLGAEERSWITVVARAGIDNFISWFADDAKADVNPGSLFNAAPRALTRKVSLHQTVDLVRTTVDVVGEQINELVPPQERRALELAIVYFSRDVAFAAAELYARAAELRGGWDERMEALIIDAVVRGEADDMVVSRASALGWHSQGAVMVVVGPSAAGADLESYRHAAEALGLAVLASRQGGRVILIGSGEQLTDRDAALALVARLESRFGVGNIIVGPLAPDLANANRAARTALAAARVAYAWPDCPRVASSAQLLPERALANQDDAREALLEEIYKPLADAGGELLHTAASFLEHGSLEATARSLFIHPNTVRYRLKRIAQTTGNSLTNPRQAYVLRLAITLGRLAEGQEEGANARMHR
ncbi:helix-turn-helix domain-containing protein [Propionibacterium freudenreichii]|uniref:PucR family transcriptional regulator n=1 Tax=Propionibacterium freudenreichii TaxID=1744 RepID=UPI0025514C72|nr:helix-turn-helix domain-containing protein [Propionibacterium freudenreichii]MDK9298447.1 helix-turn-helix domain-containing protein [Propionibacterium freudenreichii]